MANNYFQFKQFKIWQDKCAMKVTTDACVFGAAIITAGANRILDIGTGTGILSLMLAQRTQATIDAVEVDEMSGKQAETNFHESPWRDRLQMQLVDIRNFESRYSYDLIISNPPFYKNSIKSSKAGKNRSMHEVDLTQNTLVESVDRMLEKSGSFYVLYPEFEANKLNELITSLDYHKIWHCDILNHSQATPLRIMQGFSRENKPIINNKIVIRDSDQVYTSQFKELLKDYYLDI